MIQARAQISAKRWSGVFIRAIAGSHLALSTLFTRLKEAAIANRGCYRMCVMLDCRFISGFFGSDRPPMMIFTLSAINLNRSWFNVKSLAQMLRDLWQNCRENVVADLRTRSIHHADVVLTNIMFVIAVAAYIRNKLQKYLPIRESRYPVYPRSGRKTCPWNLPTYWTYRMRLSKGAYRGRTIAPNMKIRKNCFVEWKVARCSERRNI